jgi:hypothetical protein
MNKFSCCLSVFVLFLGSSLATAQETNDDASEKKQTKLEAFQARSGAVVIYSSSKIGSVEGKKLGTAVHVECNEVTNPASGERTYGLAVSVKTDSRVRRTTSASVDYDEIASLIKGINYIAKVDTSVTELKTFTASYTTKGGLTLTTLNNERGEIFSAVKTGRIGNTAIITPEKLTQLSKLIEKAKIRIDAIKK